MASTNDGRPETPAEARPEATPRREEPVPRAAAVVHPAQSTSPLAGPIGAAHPAHGRRKLFLLAAVLIGLAIGVYFLIPIVSTMLNTASTDDAYVNGHVTFVAPRVQGQAKRVLVGDNYRVKKGDVLVELDKEPYQVQLALKQAAMEAAQADLTAAQAQVRGLVGQARASRFKLEHTIEDVNNQIANLRGAAENLKSKKATLELARANLKRGEELAPQGIS